VSPIALSIGRVIRSVPWCARFNPKKIAFIDDRTSTSRAAMRLALHLAE
jgi:hypothetical protein